MDEIKETKAATVKKRGSLSIFCGNAQLSEVIGKRLHELLMIGILEIIKYLYM